jgi:hypothetical protein
LWRLRTIPRLPNLLRWLKDAKPDIVCLQELKCADEAFPADALATAGYRSVWRGQRTWNGVAILSRGAEPVVTRTALPSDPDDGQARYIEAAVDGILIACIYLPNGNPQPGPKFDYKLARAPVTMPRSGLSSPRMRQSRGARSTRCIAAHVTPPSPWKHVPSIDLYELRALMGERDAPP